MGARFDQQQFHDFILAQGPLPPPDLLRQAVAQVGLIARRALLRKTNPGGPIISGPMTYRVGTRHYVSVIAGLSMCTFGLDD